MLKAWQVSPQCYCEPNPKQSFSTLTIALVCVRKAAKLFLQYLHAQPPQVLSQIIVSGLLRWISDFAIGNDLSEWSAVSKTHTTGSRMHILSLDTILDHIFARRCKQGRPAPFIHRVLHERPDGCYSNLCWGPVGINGLFLLVRTHTPRMHSVDPGPGGLGALETGLVVAHATYHGPYNENLSELGAGVQRIGTNIGVDL